MLVLSLLGISTWLRGVRPDLSEAFAQPEVALEWAAALLTGVSAAISAFYISVPGRAGWWLFLPLLATGAWLLSLAYGIAFDWIHTGWDAFRVPESWECVRLISATTIFLSPILLMLLRHAAYVRPTETVLLTVLSIAALASADQDFAHTLHRAASVLVWHGGTIVVLLCAYSLVGPQLLNRFEPGSGEQRNGKPM